MADLDAIRNALATNLQQIPDVEQGDLQVSAYMQAQAITPIIEIFPDKFLYDTPTLFTDELRFKVRALAANTIDIGAQKLLDHLLDTSGDQSVLAALESDPTLGGLCDDLTVEQCSGYRLFPELGTHLLGCEWTVSLIVTR